MTMILSNLILVGIVGCNFRRFWANWRTILSRGLGADGPDCLIALCIFVVLGAVLWPLYSSRMIPQHDGKMWSGGSCWADLPIHMHIAESFLQVRAGWAAAEGYAARDWRRWKGARRVLVLAHAHR